VRASEAPGAAYYAYRVDGPREGVLEEAFHSEGLELPPSAAECDSHSIKIATVAQSDALALVGKPMLAEPMVAALLEEIALSKPFPLLTAGLYTRSDERLTPAARDLSAAIASECKKILRLN
jgi:DNA-binding transcriptional LysR family regulator